MTFDNAMDLTNQIKDKEITLWVLIYIGHTKNH